MKLTAIPALRSTHVVDGDSVRCLLARRPPRRLSAVETRAIEQIDGPRTLVEIEAAAPGTAPLLGQLAAEGWLVLLEPRGACRRGAPRPDGDRLVVVEPHSDDAVLSTGGQLLRLAGERPLHIVTVIGPSNYTSSWSDGGPLLTADVVTRMREREARQVATVLGAGWETLGILDAPLRCLPPARWEDPAGFAESRALFGDFMRSPVTEQELARVAALLGEVLDRLDPDEVWLPLGVGGHRDHLMTARAGIAVCRAPRRRTYRLAFYPEVPYLVNDPENVAVRLDELRARGMRLRAHDEAIDDVLDAKIALAQLYGSQSEVTQPDLLLAAARLPPAATNAGPFERRFDVVPDDNILPDGAGSSRS
jgi:LmbE family N-acetylglucosaminyl deacetylase